MESELYFEREVRQGGGSLVIVLPPEIIKYLGIEDGSKIRWIADKSKHGKFAGLWNPNTQKKE